MRYFALFLLVLVSCTTTQKPAKLDIQGHRGARGLMPENTIEGFIKAIDLGVTTLEMDLSVTGDGQIVLSHEPFFSPEFCADTTGVRIKEDSVINIYELDYAELSRFDCGMLPHPRFPNQAKFFVSKPLLVDVLDTVETYTKAKGLNPISYNIELKTTKSTDDLFHPKPSVFSDMVYEILSAKEVKDRVIIQSFDFRTLQYFNTKYPEVVLALLIENDLPWQKNVDSLGFTPQIYSCNFNLLNKAVISKLGKSMKVIPWTVNEVADMQKLISWGVDGIITDYPDRLVKLQQIK